MVQKRNRKPSPWLMARLGKSIAEREVSYSFAWKAAIPSALVLCFQRKSGTASDCHVRFEVHLA
jgi:hypothetical protein